MPDTALRPPRIRPEPSRQPESAPAPTSALPTDNPQHDVGMALASWFRQASTPRQQQAAPAQAPAQPATAAPAPAPAAAAPPRIALASAAPQQIPTMMGGQAPASGAGGNDPMAMLRALLTSISPPPQPGLQSGPASIAGIRG